MDFFLLFSLTLLYTTISFTAGADANVTAAEGDNCTLPCNISKKISSLVWTHSALKKCLLVFRAERVQEEYEDPKYRDRVQLVDPQLHSGDLSVVLKNITSQDTGTYECQVFIKDNQKTSQFIHLRVTAREQDTTNNKINTETNTLRQFRGLFCGLGIGLVSLFIILSVLRCVHRQQESGKSVPLDSEKCSSVPDEANPLSDPTNQPPRSSCWSSFSNFLKAIKRILFRAGLIKHFDER